MIKSYTRRGVIHRSCRTEEVASVLGRSIVRFYLEAQVFDNGVDRRNHTRLPYHLAQFGWEERWIVDVAERC